MNELAEKRRGDGGVKTKQEVEMLGRGCWYRSTGVQSSFASTPSSVNWVKVAVRVRGAAVCDVILFYGSGNFHCCRNHGNWKAKNMSCQNKGTQFPVF